MHILVLALAILLLPLRSWLGDAMAMEMAQRQATMAATHEVADPHAGHAMHDMAATGGDDLQMAAGDTSHDHPAHAPDCQSTCASCQLCHSVALTVWPEAPPMAALPRAAPRFASAAFASAEPAPGFKPPIS